MTHIFLTVTISFSILSAFTQNFTEKKIGHVFYISVPDYMEETRGLNDAAIFQYQNEIKQAYTMIIDDAKSNLKAVGITFNSCEEYYRSIEPYYLNENDKPAETIQKLTINGNNAIQVELIRHFDMVDLFYLITVVETPNYYYQIVSWTSVENKNTLLKDFIKLAASLKE